VFVGDISEDEERLLVDCLGGGCGGLEDGVSESGIREGEVGRMLGRREDRKKGE
jgi:hypothetical protein